MRYNPFRITPYLLKVQGKGSSVGEEEPCCLALAERIISGYEGTKIQILCLINHNTQAAFLWLPTQKIKQSYKQQKMESLPMHDSAVQSVIGKSYFYTWASVRYRNGVSVIICLYSTPDPLGQAHLYHHTLTWLCVPGSGRQVNKCVPNQRLNEVFLNCCVLMKLIAQLLSTELCRCWDTFLKILLVHPC